MDSELNNVDVFAEKLKSNTPNSVSNTTTKYSKPKIVDQGKNDTEINGNGSDDTLNSNLETKKSHDQSIDNNLPETVELFFTPQGSKCYLVGTVHFSVESQNDVAKIIQAVQPHAVVVELCSDRIHVLQLDEETILKEAKDLSFNKIIDIINQNGLYRGLFHAMLLDLTARITKVLGLAPGGEFRRALAEAKNLPDTAVILGDRSIKVTLGRALQALSWWQTCKLAWQLLTMKDTINHDEVEKCKSRDALEEMMQALAEEYPALEQVFVKERDMYLTHSLQSACKPYYTSGKLVPRVVVGVVGIGHMPGIKENWGKVDASQIPPIMIIPPPTLSSKVLKITFKVSLLVAVGYAGYKLVPGTSKAFLWLKSSATELGQKIFQ